MYRRLLLLFFLFFPVATQTFASSLLTERDWMVNLVESMGWSYGLPDEPTDADYQQLLTGARHFRFEAEDMVAANAPGMTRDLASYGEYSGRGWLAGVAGPTATRLRFLLPRGGKYQLTAALRQAGHRLRIGGRQFTADGGYRFSREPLGTIELAAGEVIVDLELPIEGGIDYLELTAPPLPPIQPADGWHPDRPLTATAMAQTTVQLLGLLPLLPALDERLTIEAEAVAAGALPAASERFLGEPSGGGWLRAGSAPATVELKFKLETGGVFDLKLRVAGPGTTVRVNGHPASVAPLPYLENCHLGTFELPPGDVRIEVNLPPRAGVDALFLHRRSDADADYRRLAGLAEGALPPSATQIEKILALLAVLGAP